jgi:hypothetical protein
MFAWLLLYVAIIVAVACFVAWGFPDIGSWHAMERAGMLALAAHLGFLWWAIGLQLAEDIR